MDGIGSWVSMGEKSVVCSTFVRWKWLRGNILQGREIFKSVGELFSFFSLDWNLKGQKGTAKRRNKNEFNLSDMRCRISNDWTKTHHFWRHDFCQPSSRVCAETRIREGRETVSFLQISEKEDWRNSLLLSLPRSSFNLWRGRCLGGLGYASVPPSIFDITLVESDERSRKRHANFMGSASLARTIASLTKLLLCYLSSSKSTE